MAFCRQCGAALEQGDRSCPACGSPVREAPGALAAAMPYQGVGIRFAAQLIDGVVLVVLFWGLGYIIGGAAGNLTEDGFKMTGGPALLLISLNFILWLVYFILAEGLGKGQSLGKKLVGIRVVNPGGGRISFNQAIVRNVLRMVDGLACYLVGAVLVCRSPRKQRLGDRVAGTVVVRKGRG